MPNSGAGVGLLMERNAWEENEFHQADVLFETELTGHPSHGLQQLHRVQRGLIESRTRSDGRWRSDAAALAGLAFAPDIRGMLDTEFVCKGDVILAIDQGSAPESVPSFSDYLNLVSAAPPLKAGAPVSSPGDSAAPRRGEAFENGFEIEPRLWSERGRAQSHSSVAGGYSL
jgi:LDH2 family malate/lactate/ureidoglycolate dehydrogenase